MLAEFQGTAKEAKRGHLAWALNDLVTADSNVIIPLVDRGRVSGRSNFIGGGGHRLVRLRTLESRRPAPRRWLSLPTTPGSRCHLHAAPPRRGAHAAHRCPGHLPPPGARPRRPHDGPALTIPPEVREEVRATLGFIAWSALSFLGLSFRSDHPTWGKILLASTDRMADVPERVI